MMEFYIIGQTIRCATPAIASQSLKYLEAKFSFSGEDWDGYSKWAHFRQGETVFDFALDEANEIKAEKELNLTLGEWEVYVTGLDENDSRITTTVFIITVYKSGLIDEPLHPMPASVAEQIDAKASTALLMAQAVKEMADAGEFDGDSFKVLGFFDTLAELENSITDPEPGDAYGVANGDSYDNYIWNDRNKTWVNNGPLAGTPGADGKKGTTFTPSVDGNGNLSWTNDGGLENPETTNIRGPQGEPGEAGAEGKGPYELAQENGYTGTEATFNAAITQFPYHNARHLPGGADPITVETGNIKDGAVTPAKLDRPYLSLGLRTLIPSGADLNDYLTPGSYAAQGNAVAATILNSPTSVQFTLDVFTSAGASYSGAPTTANYRYYLQRVTGYLGSIWQREVAFVNSTTPIFGEWKRILTTDDIDSFAPAYTCGTEDLTAGTSELETGKLYFVYE